MVNYRPYYHCSILLLYIVDILLCNIKHFYISSFFMQVMIRLQLIFLVIHYVKKPGKHTDFISQVGYISRGKTTFLSGFDSSNLGS